MVIVLLLWPRLFPFRCRGCAQTRGGDRSRACGGVAAIRFRAAAGRPQSAETTARADASDQDRRARAPERAPNPTNPLPFSKGRHGGAGRSRPTIRPRGAAARRRTHRLNSRRRPSLRPTTPSSRNRSRRSNCHRAAPRSTSRRRRGRRAAVIWVKRSETCSVTCRPISSAILRRRRHLRAGHSVRHEGRRVRAVAPALRRTGEAKLESAHPARGGVYEGPRRGDLQHPQGRHDFRSHGGRALSDRRVQQRGVTRRDAGDQPDVSRCRRISVGPGIFHGHLLLQ